MSTVVNCQLSSTVVTCSRWFVLNAFELSSHLQKLCALQHVLGHYFRFCYSKTSEEFYHRICINPLVQLENTHYALCSLRRSCEKYIDSLDCTNVTYLGKRARLNFFRTTVGTELKFWRSYSVRSQLKQRNSLRSVDLQYHRQWWQKRER